MKNQGLFKNTVQAIFLISFLVFVSCGERKGQKGLLNTMAKQGAYYTNQYPNILEQAGYSKDAIEKRIAQVYMDLFEGPNRIYFEVGDSMAYLSDIKNQDVRSEGMSYGMMIAVQTNNQVMFDRLWRWSKHYLEHKDGPSKGYFAWSFNPVKMQRNAQGTASDGELFYVTSLLFASNLWGNATGINYYADARGILDAMWAKDGSHGIHNIINVEAKQITFVPEGKGSQWTDPSYHVAPFFEVWADYAEDGHEQFYRDCADTARAFLHRACHPITGLNYDYTEFSGEPHSAQWMPAAFRYDSWRVPMNIAMDYVWFGVDSTWQQSYVNRIQNFLRKEGVHTFLDQYNPDGSTPDFILNAGGFKKRRHSLGFVSTAATTAMVNPGTDSFEFVHELWNSKLEPYEDGYLDTYFDGLMHLFSLMHLSGNYKAIHKKP